MLGAVDLPCKLAIRLLIKTYGRRRYSGERLQGIVKIRVILFSTVSLRRGSLELELIDLEAEVARER